MGRATAKVSPLPLVKREFTRVKGKLSACAGKSAADLNVLQKLLELLPLAVVKS